MLSTSLNAIGFLNKICDLARALTVSCYWRLLQHTHAQADPHSLPLAKHSQYNFKHFDLRQLQGLCSDWSETWSSWLKARLPRML